MVAIGTRGGLLIGVFIGLVIALGLWMLGGQIAQPTTTTISYTGAVAGSTSVNTTTIIPTSGVYVPSVLVYYHNESSGQTSLGGRLTGFSTKTQGGNYTFGFTTHYFGKDISVYENITSVYTNTTGFSVLFVSPAMPIKLLAGNNATIDATLQLPARPYAGLVSIVVNYSIQ